MGEKLSRRDFLKISGGGLALWVLNACGVDPNNFPDPTQKPNPTETKNPTVEAPTATPASPEEISQLTTEISAEIQAAVSKTDIVTQKRWEAIQGAQDRAAIFANKLTSPEDPNQRVIARGSYSVLILPSGHVGLRLVVESTWGRAGEVLFIDTGENEPMVVSLEGGLKVALGMDDADIETERDNYEIGVKEIDINLKDEAVEGEEEKYWYATILSKLSGETAAVVDATRNWTSDLESAISLEALDVIPEIANEVLIEKIEFPNDLKKEHYSSLVKEMNAQRGPKPIYVEVVDAGGNPNVMYYDTQTRQMETLEGTYLDNKELIDKHGFNIYAEIGQNEQGLTTYIHPDTGEETIVENSGNIDWDWVGNKNNASEEIDPKTLENDTIYSSLNRRDGSVLQVILINQDPAGLVFEQGKYFDYNCLDTILVRNGLGIRTLVGPKAIMELVEEGSSEAEKLGALKSTSAIRALKANATYYVFFEKDQAHGWEESMQSIDSLENVFDAEEMYNKAMEGQSADGVVVLRSPIIVLRKNK